MPRGGRRKGAPGKRYPNRSDLNNGPRQVTVPGQAYGKAAEQQRSLRAVPMAESPASDTDGFMQAMQAAQEFRGVDEQAVGSIERETEFPDEPLTAGSPFGPGPGPEALGLQGFGPPGATMFNPSPAAAVVTYLASLPIASPEVQELAYMVGQQRAQQTQLPELLPEPAGLMGGPELGGMPQGQPEGPPSEMLGPPTQPEAPAPPTLQVPPEPDAAQPPAV